MEERELSPADEKTAEMLANIIAKTAERGGDVRAVAGDVVKTLVEIDKIKQTPEAAYSPVDYSPPSARTVRLTDDMVKKPGLGLF